jgi:hypothetical protein
VPRDFICLRLSTGWMSRDIEPHLQDVWKFHGPGSNLSDRTLLELSPNGKLILAGGSGNGYRFAELGSANNPSGWSGVLKVKTPAGATFGYILLYTNP